MSNIRILLVDDDAMLCRAVERMLRPYQVTLASSAAEALDAVKADEFDLILCDVMMPGMSGPELFHALEPALQRRMVFMTGGMLEHIEPMMKGVPNKLIEKPFSRAELKLAIEDAIEALSAS